MANFERQGGPMGPNTERKVPPSEIIRQKMAEMPRGVSQTPASIPQTPKPRRRVNIFSIIILIMLLGLAGFTIINLSSINSAIRDLRTSVGAGSPELETQKSRIDLFERTLTELRTNTENKTKELEDKISGTTGFASSADLETLKNILKTTDSDKDGLSDYDEVVIYKSNPNLRDTDGDGFSDKTEVDRGFSPTGPGKLEVTEQMTTEEKKIVKVTASNYKFEPSTIEVKTGDNVRIELSSIDTTHTFTIDALNINKEVKGGQTEIVEFEPTTVGEYIFYSNTTTDRQNNMEGKLIVK
jgi:plastocyanin